MDETKINEMITERMIERIQTTGELPWHKPWVSQDARPQNLISRKPYRGVNTFLLHMMGYAQPFFLTMKQVNGLGGHVRKGEKSMPVIFWKFVDADKKDPESKSYAILRYYHVFNVAQCDGIPEGKVPELETPDREINPITDAEQLWRICRTDRKSSMDGRMQPTARWVMRCVCRRLKCSCPMKRSIRRFFMS